MLRVFFWVTANSLLPATNNPVVIYFLLVTRIIETIIENSKLTFFCLNKLALEKSLPDRSDRLKLTPMKTLQKLQSN